MPTSRCATTSALPETPPLPWLYSYEEDTRSTRLGSVGFLDRFTITASRYAQAIAVEDRDAFDERFGTVLSV